LNNPSKNVKKKLLENHNVKILLVLTNLINYNKLGD